MPLISISVMQIISVFILTVFVFQTNGVNEYGPYDMDITKILPCKGPRQKDCGVARVSLWVENGTASTLHAKANIKENLSKFRIKVVGIMNNKEYLRWDINDVCDSLTMKMIIKTLLQLTDDCVVLKGSYDHTMDLAKVQGYFATQFIYGNYTFKNYFYSDKCNYFCASMHMRYYPKN